jgi:D-cysteine desulfhydrase
MSHSTIDYPPRVSLARTPTPLQPSRRVGPNLGIDLYFKRDDLTGGASSGNKIRKLEFSMAEALARKADIVLTCGGAQSNHCRATAVAAAKLGLGCRLYLRTADPKNPPPLSGNLLLDRLLGAEIVWVTPEEYKARTSMFEREADSLRKQGRRPYVIPEGASNAVGAWGYVRAFEELNEDMAHLGWNQGEAATIVCATGSGGTAAGLLLGSKLLGANVHLVAVNVCDNREYFVQEIGKICRDFIATGGLDVKVDPSRDVDIRDGYVGRGYALSQPAELALIREVARAEGLVLDPVYTGKAFYGLTQEIKTDPTTFGRRVIFVHTGGLLGLFPLADEIARIL